MKFSRSDFALMQWSLLAICVVVLLSAAFVYGNGQYAARMQQDWRDTQARLNDARRQLASTREDQANMSTYAENYVTLVDAGVIGDGQRLDWMEGLERLRQQHLVDSFRYHIGPQKPYVQTPPIDSGNFDILYSEMKLEFELLHEGQLLNFFSALNEQVRGHYQLEGCTLKRRSPGEDGAAGGLDAECRGGWITLKNRNATP
jgi:hypothetical protein